jgi:endonuclease/exonuclease/phosphatase family metal-dependent hydrolase
MDFARASREERWDQAELALIRGLATCGYRDAFRLLHPHAIGEISWGWPRWDGGYRLDHLIVSRDLTVEECRYEHSSREDGLSDHSALLATLHRSGFALALDAASADPSATPPVRLPQSVVRRR